MHQKRTLNKVEFQRYAVVLFEGEITLCFPAKQNRTDPNWVRGDARSEITMKSVQSIHEVLNLNFEQYDVFPHK